MSATRIGSLVKGGSASAAQPSAIARDSATLTGDLIVVWFVVRNASNAPQVSPPDGTWTRVPGNNTDLVDPNTTFWSGSNSTRTNAQVFYKTATTDGAQSYTFSFSGTSVHVWFARTYRGAGTPTVLGSNTFTTSTTPATAAISDTGEDAILLERLIFGAVASGSTAMTGSALTWDGAVTKSGDQQGAGTTGLVWGSRGYETGPSPHGAVAARTITLTNAPVNGGTVTLGVPASGGGGGAAPTNSAVPVISTDGSPETGEAVTSDTGTWANTPTSYAYQWKRDGTTSLGTSSSYTLVTADEGHSITSTVTATNATGSASATSAAIVPTAPPPATAPVNTVLPVISTDGTPEVGETVTCSTGTWDNSPTSYAYQWRRSGVSIGGATTSSYTLVSSDVGTGRISCSVTATNSGGSATENAASISPILSGAAVRSVTRYRYT